MKHRMFTMGKVATLMLLLISFAACEKYEDGPLISLRSKKERVANTWKVDKATVNGLVLTYLYTDFTLSLNKNGRFNLSDPTSMVSGKWEFESKKEKIKLTGDDGTTEEWTITRLKEKEMSVTIDEGGDKIELDFVEK